MSKVKISTQSRNKYSYSRWSVAGFCVCNNCREQQMKSVKNFVYDIWAAFVHAAPPLPVSSTAKVPSLSQNQQRTRESLFWDWLNIPHLGLTELKANRPRCAGLAKAVSAPHPYLCLEPIRGHKPSHRHLVGCQSACLIGADDIAATWSKEVFNQNS